MDTIYALATARGRAGVSVIRLSGPKAHDVVSNLTRKALPALRQAALRRFFWQEEIWMKVLFCCFQLGKVLRAKL